MPYKSDAQRRFFHTDTAKKAGITNKEVNEFDKASKGMKLPEKKMAFGGETNPEHETVKAMENNPTAGFAGGGQAEADQDFASDDQGLQTPPEVLAALGMLAGGSAMAEDVPEMLGNESGAVSLGGNAPEMEGEAPKIEAYVKGIQKNPNGEDIKIWGVKGDPNDLKAAFGDEAPGSVPEQILRDKGILPSTTIDASTQNAPNSFAEGGEAQPTLGSENPILAKLKELLGSDKSQASQADAIDPVVTSSETVKGYDEGGDVSMDDSDALAALLSGGGQNPNANAAAALKLYGPASAQDQMTMTPQGAQMMDMSAPINPMLQGMGNTAAQPLSIPPGAHIAPQAAPVMAPQGQPPMIGKTLPPAPGQQPPQMPSLQQAAQAIQQKQEPDIYQGVSAEDRAKLAQQLLAKQSSGGGLLASGAAGLGDAVSNSFGKGGANFQNQVRQNATNTREAALNTVDTERAQKMQDLEAHIAVAENDPSSSYSQGMRQFVTAFTGKQVPSGVSAGMLKSAFGDLAKIFDAQLTAAVATSGQKVEAQKAGAERSVWQRLTDKVLGEEPAETALQNTASGGKMPQAPGAPKLTTPGGINYTVSQ